MVKRGLYFGSCLFGSLDNAEFVLTECSGVEWIAGYTTAVDWINSTVVDLFFLRHYLFPAPGKGNSAEYCAEKSGPCLQNGRDEHAVVSSAS